MDRLIREALPEAITRPLADQEVAEEEQNSLDAGDGAERAPVQEQEADREADPVLSRLEARERLEEADLDELQKVRFSVPLTRALAQEAYDNEPADLTDALQLWSDGSVKEGEGTAAYAIRRGAACEGGRALRGGRIQFPDGGHGCCPGARAGG